MLRSTGLLDASIRSRCRFQANQGNWRVRSHRLHPQLHDPRSLDEISEALEAVVAWVQVRRDSSQFDTDFGQIHVVFFINCA